jgi:thiamine phosphate synthase YjbQ (UPF0047 family)
MVFTRKVQVSTSAQHDMVDVTSRVARAVKDSGISEGIALVFTLHTTTGLYINEQEGGLVADVDADHTATTA